MRNDNAPGTPDASEGARLHLRPGQNKRSGRSPRTPVTTWPIFVSQITALVVFGFKTERAFREWVARHKLLHARDGQSIFVEVDVVRAKLRELSTTEAEERPGTPIATHDDEQPADAATVLARLGLRLVGGAK